jgi:microcystin-dependent protein
MADPFLGEIRIISFSYAPKGWALCDGQLLPINQNQALYSLLGAMYGGDGQTTFALPDLRGRAATHAGMGLTQGSSGGQTTVTLTIRHMPTHSHTIIPVDAPGISSDPSSNLLAKSAGHIYGSNPATDLASSSLASAGSGQPHQNMQPSLVLNFMIALQGMFPSRS